MISFVRRLNPFRKLFSSEQPMSSNIVTRSVQTDLDDDFSLQWETSPTSVVDVTIGAKSTRTGINKLLRALKNENLAVATLLDQDGRVFFTIDLTEIIENDVELNKIVETVRKSMQRLSQNSLEYESSDELSKKLKRHFLFESIKKLSAQHNNKSLSESYFTVREKNTESQRKTNEKTRLNIDKPREVQQYCVSVDEAEIKSLLYEVTSTMTPEENMKFIDTLESSLITNIYKKIERTIENIKQKQKINLQEFEKKIEKRNHNQELKKDGKKVPFSMYKSLVDKKILKDSKHRNNDTGHDTKEKEPKRPQTRRNPNFERPIYKASSSSSKEIRHINYASSSGDSLCLKRVTTSLPFEPKPHNRKSLIQNKKEPEQVQKRVVKQNSGENSFDNTKQIKVENGFDNVKRKNGNSQKFDTTKNKKQETASGIMSNSKRKKTCPKNRPITSLEDRRAQILSTRRDIKQRYTKKVSTRKCMDTVVESSRVKNHRESLKKKLDHIKKHQRKGKMEQDTENAKRDEKKRQKHEKEDAHQKKDVSNDKRDRGETKKRKHTRNKLKNDSKTEDLILIANSKDRDITLYRNEAMHKSIKNTKRKNTQKRPILSKVEIFQAGYTTSSEFLREQPKVVNKTLLRKQKYQRKNDINGIKKSEKLIAVVSFDSL